MDMKKLKQKINKVFKEENYNELDGKKYIKDFINNNKNKFKDADSLKLMVRFCIKEYEDERTKQNGNTVPDSESIDATNR